MDGAFVPHGQLHAQPGGLLSIDSKQLALAQQGGNLTFGSGELNPYPAYTCMWHVQHQWRGARQDWLTTVASMQCNNQSTSAYTAF